MYHEESKQNKVTGVSKQEWCKGETEGIGYVSSFLCALLVTPYKIVSTGVREGYITKDVLIWVYFLLLVYLERVINDPSTETHLSMHLKIGAELMVAIFLFPAEEAKSGLTVAQETKKDVVETMAYLPDITRNLPTLYAKRKVIWKYKEKLFRSSGVLIKHRMFFLPHLDEVFEKMEFLLPALDDVIPYIHKVGPHIGLVLPKIEMLAPHIKSVLPHWDDISGNIEVFMDSLDSLGPYLYQLIPNMGRLIPVLDLMPLINDIGILQVKAVAKILPTFAAWLPSEKRKWQRYFLLVLSRLSGNCYMKVKLAILAIASK